MKEKESEVLNMKIKQRDFIPNPSEFISDSFRMTLIDMATEMYLRGKYGENVIYEIDEYDPDFSNIAEVTIYEETGA